MFYIFVEKFNMVRKIQNEELGRMGIEEFKKSQKFPFILVLDNIRSMQNIGSIFRTADAFRIEELLLCGITACPPHREIQRAALDAAESVNWKYFEKTIQVVDYLHNKEYKVFAVEQTDSSIPLHEMKLLRERKTALVFGNEINGVDIEVLNRTDGCIEIPQFGTKHSLNVAVSAGIALWDLFTKAYLSESGGDKSCFL